MTYKQPDNAFEEPPVMLDGTRVAEFARFDSRVEPPAHVSVNVGGVTLDLRSVTGLVIAEDLVDGGVYLLHCNDRWETLAAGRYDRADAARAAADAAYSGIDARWTVYRELTTEERSEVETTRAFLRQMAAEYPSE